MDLPRWDMPGNILPEDTAQVEVRQGRLCQIEWSRSRSARKYWSGIVVPEDLPGNKMGINGHGWGSHASNSGRVCIMVEVKQGTSQEDGREWISAGDRPYSTVLGLAWRSMRRTRQDVFQAHLLTAGHGTTGHVGKKLVSDDFGKLTLHLLCSDLTIRIALLGLAHFFGWCLRCCVVLYKPETARPIKLYSCGC